MFEELFDWTTATFGAFGLPGLFVLGVIESIFFPVPVDVLLIVLAVADPSLWWLFAIVGTLGSVTGAAISYKIGQWGGEHVVRRIIPEKQMRQVHDMFEKYETLAIFLAGFTPLPYKAFAVGAGVFYISFWPFIFASFLARALRFLIVAFLAAWVAENAVTGPLMNGLIALGVLTAIWFWVGSRLWRR